VNIYVGLCEDTRDHGDVCTAHGSDGTAVESSHPIHTTLTKARAFPQGTSAKPSRGATRQTSKQSASVVAESVAAGSGAADVVGVGAVDWLSSSLSSSSRL